MGAGGIKQLQTRQKPMTMDEILEVSRSGSASLAIVLPTVTAGGYAPTVHHSNNSHMQHADQSISMTDVRNLDCGPWPCAMPALMSCTMQVLIAKAGKEAEEAQRLLLFALNGLAALSLLNNDNTNAIKLYREVRRWHLQEL